MEEKSNVSRCVNIDWLELYCMESGLNFPHDASYYESRGFRVRRRDYGTRQYAEMFTILDKDDEAFLEVRRNPVAGSSAMALGIFNPYSCHVRLSNRYCYHPHAVTLMSDFLLEHGYSIERIFRIDICYDFTKFDYGDDPKEFLRRYMRGKYSKVNQCNLTAHGRDAWEERVFNSISWGSPTSMVSTKFYCKTQELREAKDKPYIRYAWWSAGLIDDWTDCSKKSDDGTIEHPDIWRVEFSIRSAARGWFVVDDANGKKPKRFRQPHDLGTYATKPDLWKAWCMLAYHYFHFKHFEPGTRKDRCNDKLLFRFDFSEVYKLDKLLTDRPASRAIDRLKAKLEHYRLTHFDAESRKACDVLLAKLKTETVRNAVPSFDMNEAKLLQQLLSRRLAGDDSITIEQMEALLAISDEIF